MKKKWGIIGVIGAAVLWFGGVGLGGGHRKEDRPTAPLSASRGGGADAPSAAEPKSASVGNRKAKEVDLDALERLVQNLNQRTDEEEASEMSDRDLARYAIMTEKVSSHFFDEGSKAFDDILSRETRNPGWTRLREAALTGLLENDVLSGVRLFGIDCYETLCKIEVSSRDEEGLIELQRRVSRTSDLYGPGHYFSTPKEDGSFVSNVYLGKPREDDTVLNAVIEQLYRNVTGESPDEIEPTQAEVERAVADRDNGLSPA